MAPIKILLSAFIPCSKLHFDTKFDLKIQSDFIKRKQKLLIINIEFFFGL